MGLPAGGEVSICRLPAWGLSCLLPAPLYLSQVPPSKPPAFLSSRPVCVLDDLADTRSICPRPPAPPRSEGPWWGLLPSVRQSAGSGSASPSFKFLLHKAAAASFVAFLSFLLGIVSFCMQKSFVTSPSLPSLPSRHLAFTVHAPSRLLFPRLFFRGRVGRVFTPQMTVPPTVFLISSFSLLPVLSSAFSDSVFLAQGGTHAPHAL